MEFILFLGLVGLLVYMQNISGRLAKLERASRALPGITPASVSASTAHGAAVTSPTSASPSLGGYVKGRSGSNTAVSQISPAQWVGGVGVVALIFGIAFFFKYAIDQGWISEWTRLGLGALVGSLLLLLGDLWKTKFAKYAQVLTGGGLAILYFTIFASFQYYHKVDQPIAFLLAVLVSVLGVVLSYRQNSKTLGVLSVLGAYLSPLLISSGENQQIALFTYLTIVNVGVLLMLLKSYWTELLFVALIGTGIDFAIWAVSYSGPDNTGVSLAFLLFNYLLVALLTAIIFRKIHEAGKLQPKTDVHLGFFYAIFGIFMFGTVTALLHEPFRDYIAPVMLLFGVITYLSYAVLDRLDYHKINFPMSLVGAKFLVAAVMWQFTGMTENIYLLALAILGVGVGVAVKRKDLRVWGLVLLLVVAWKTVLQDYNTDAYVVLFNARFITEVLILLTLFVFAQIYQRTQLAGDELHVPSVLRVAGATLLWIAGSQEIVSQFSNYESTNVRNLSLSVWWMVYAVILSFIGGVRNMHVLRKVAAVLFGVTVLKVFLYDVQALELGYRVVSFILLGVILLIVAFFYQKNKDKLVHFWSGEERESELGVRSHEL